MKIKKINFPEQNSNAPNHQQTQTNEQEQLHYDK